MKFDYNGKQVNGIRMEFQPDQTKGGEQWSTYAIGDGSELRLKPVVTQIFKLEGEYQPDGSPVYHFQSSNAYALSSPDSLMKDTAVK